MTLKKYQESESLHRNRLPHINDSEKVKPELRRASAGIEELNFYPNTHARTLVSERSLCGPDHLDIPTLFSPNW